MQTLGSGLQSTLGDPANCRQPEASAQVLSALRTVQASLQTEERWEVACEFVGMLSALLVGDARRTPLDLDRDVLSFLFHGDGSFHGLTAWLRADDPPSLAESASARDSTEGDMAGLARWIRDGLQVLSGERQFGKWIDGTHPPPRNTRLGLPWIAAAPSLCLRGRAACALTCVDSGDRHASAHSRAADEGDGLPRSRADRDALQRGRGSGCGLWNVRMAPD